MFYQSIAEYYDFIFPPSVKQKLFIESELEGLDGKRLLEAGCGTGNLAFLLSEEGAEVTGIDLDEEMISKAKLKNSREQDVAFEKLDILKLNQRWTEESFNGIISFGNTMVHLRDSREVGEFLKGCYQVLKPGAKLLVQIINYDRILDKGIKGLPTIENDKICFERNYDYDDAQKYFIFRTKLTIKETGKVINNKVKLFPIRQSEVLNLLKGVGFEDLMFYGNFDRKPVDSDSTPLIFSAVKPSF